MNPGGVVKVLVITAILLASTVWITNIASQPNSGSREFSHNEWSRASNFTQISSVEWTNGTSLGIFISIVGSIGSSAKIVGDTNSDGKYEILTSSIDTNETGLFQYERQASLRLWEYSDSSFTLVDEKVWYGDHAYGAAANDIEVFNYGNTKYVVTGGSISYSSQTYAELRIWRYSPTQLTFVSNYSWYHYSGKNSTINSVAVRDIDNDEIPEIVACGEIDWKVGNNDNKSMGFISVFEINNDLSLSKVDDVVVSDNTVNSTGFKNVEISDLNNDGTIDIVVAGWYGFNDSGVERSKAYITIWHFTSGNLTKINEVQWIDMDSCGVFSVRFYDFNSDGISEIVAGGANKKENIAGEVSVWSYDLQQLARTQFFINPGGSPGGGLNWDCIVLGIEVGDFDEDGNVDILAVGFSKGPAAPGFSGSTFWGFLATFAYSGSNINMASKYYWLDRHITQVMTVDTADIDSDGTTEILTIGYTSQTNNQVQQMYAKVWVWRYIQGVPEINVQMFALILIILPILMKRRKL